MSDEAKVLHEWKLAGYHSRIVETQPGIVSSEQAMDDDKLGRLWLPNRSPFGWQNEMVQLVNALAASEEARERAESERLTLAKAIKDFADFRDRERDCACCGRSLRAGHGADCTVPSILALAERVIADAGKGENDGE